MLVLSRKKNETILIGEDVVVKVISTGRGKVKLGIDAPTSVRVLRGELVEAVGRHQPSGSECPNDQPNILA